MHLYAKTQKSAQICKCICRYAFAYNPLSNYKEGGNISKITFRKVQIAHKIRHYLQPYKSTTLTPHFS